MPYQPPYRYALLPDQAYSAYARPRRHHEDGSCEIQLIKFGNPSYIPADFEAWPIYYHAVMKALIQHPDVHAAAVAANTPGVGFQPAQAEIATHHFSTLLSLSNPLLENSITTKRQNLQSTKLTTYAKS